MRMINRRTFMKRAAQLPAGLAAGGILPDLAGRANAQESGGVTAAIPMPIQVVIDDVRTGAGRADLRALALAVSAAGAVSWVFWRILPA